MFGFLNSALHRLVTPFFCILKALIKERFKFTKLAGTPSVFHRKLSKFANCAMQIIFSSDPEKYMTHDQFMSLCVRKIGTCTVWSLLPSSSTVSISSLLFLVKYSKHVLSDLSLISLCILKWGDNTFVIEWFAGIHCIILLSQKICYDNPGNVPNKGSNFSTQKFGKMYLFVICMLSRHWFQTKLLLYIA